MFKRESIVIQGIKKSCHRPIRIAFDVEKRKWTLLLEKFYRFRRMLNEYLIW